MCNSSSLKSQTEWRHWQRSIWRENGRVKYPTKVQNASAWLSCLQSQKRKMLCHILKCEYRPKSVAVKNIDIADILGTKISANIDPALVPVSRHILVRPRWASMSQNQECCCVPSCLKWNEEQTGQFGHPYRMTGRIQPVDFRLKKRKTVAGRQLSEWLNNAGYSEHERRTRESGVRRIEPHPLYCHKNNCNITHFLATKNKLCTEEI